jgi:WD40 repeat protein
VLFTPDGQTLLSGGWDAVVRAWDVTTAQPMRALLGHAGPVRTLALSSDARVLASAGFDGTARLWDLEDGEELAALEAGEKLHAVAFAPAATSG